MKSRSLMIVALFALFWACEKSNKTLPIKSPEPNYFPMTKGSYWVYNSYEIDSAKNEILLFENDTVEVIGDTIINGKMHAVFYGKTYGFLNQNKTEQYYRDSLGYIVGTNGKVLFSYVNFTDTLFTEYIPDDLKRDYRFYTLMEEYKSPVDLLCGVFDSVYNCVFCVDYLSADEPLHVALENLYAPNVGRILRQNTYLTGYFDHGVYYEERLVDYHIKPLTE